MMTPFSPFARHWVSLPFADKAVDASAQVRTDGLTVHDSYVHNRLFTGLHIGEIKTVLTMAYLPDEIRMGFSKILDFTHYSPVTSSRPNEVALL